MKMPVCHNLQPQLLVNATKRHTLSTLMTMEGKHHIHPCCSFGLVVLWVLRKLHFLQLSSQWSSFLPILLIPHDLCKIIVFFCCKFSLELAYFYWLFSKNFFLALNLGCQIFSICLLEYRTSLDKWKYNSPLKVLF